MKQVDIVRMRPAKDHGHGGCGPGVDFVDTKNFWRPVHFFGMHIVGIAKDQNGKPYYVVKNSWGATNDYKGFLYVTKNFVSLKTTAFMVNKAGIPIELAKKMKL